MEGALDRPLAFAETVAFRVGYVCGLAVYRYKSGGVALVGGEDEHGQASDEERKVVPLSDTHARALASMLNEASEPKDRT